MKTAILIRLDQETKEKLNILAKQDDRSLNNYINHILKKNVSDKWELVRLI